MFVADLHNDIVQRAMIGEDISERTSVGHSDLIRLQESCIDLEVFIVWFSSKSSIESAFRKVNAMYDKLEDLEKNSDIIKITHSLESIKNCKKYNQVATPIAMEGGEAIENNINYLFSELYQLISIAFYALQDFVLYLLEYEQV